MAEAARTAAHTAGAHTAVARMAGAPMVGVRMVAGHTSAGRTGGHTSSDFGVVVRAVATTMVAPLEGLD